MPKEFHSKAKGKIEIRSKVPLENNSQLSLAYTPGVAEISLAIAENKEDVNLYTSRKNMIAIVSNGTAVLGLGNIGPEAALPVMEGKSVLFKKFGDVDAIPLCINEKDPDKVIEFVKNLTPTFAGINLEDIKAPECFEILNRLQDLGIPVFHDDQHGTAIVVLAGLINALKITNKKIKDCKIVFNGAGAAGIATAKMLIDYGAKDVILCDTKGTIYKGRAEGMNPYKEEIAEITNKDNLKGKLEDAMKNTDIFIGLSKGNLVTRKMVKSMNKNPIIFALANPNPEIMPDLAYEAGAAIVATGRSDFPNQINNVLAFPGIFRGALDSDTKVITKKMMFAAAEAIARSIKKPTKEKIIPDVFNKEVYKNVAEAVKDTFKQVL